MVNNDYSRAKRWEGYNNSDCDKRVFSSASVIDYV